MILTFWFVVLLAVGSQAVEKRILLSDPDYIQQELTRFQSELQELQDKCNTQHQENVNLMDTMSQLQGEVTKLQTTNTQLQNTVNQLKANGGAAVFTRWGRKDCPTNTTSLLYTGYAGGSMYTDPGAAAEYICLPSEPIWGPHKTLSYPDTTWVGYVYGAEYEDGNNLFGIGGGLHDVPCAVCVANHFTASLMIPGRTQCYPGWTEAYHGDLSSGSHNVAAATQYVCVDQHPQSLEGGADKDENGKLFYGVKSKCGPLHCPPYEDERLLSCVVCLK